MSGKDDNTFDEKIMADAARLSPSVTPGRDLWPGIEQAITAPVVPKRSRLGSAWAQAAAVVLLVGGSSGLTYFAMSDSDDPTVPIAAESPTLIFEPVQASFGSQYTLGPDYIDARRVLTGNLDERLGRLSPEARQDVLRNMQTIREAIDDINRALAQEPDNVLLQELLIDAYRDELSVMRRLDGIANSAMLRDDI